MIVSVLPGIGLKAQSLDILDWTFGTSSYTSSPSYKHPAISTGTVVLNANSGASLTVTGTGTTSNRQMQVGSWSGSETTSLTSGRSSTTPVSASKVLYTTFAVNSAAGGDWNALNIQLGYQRTASVDPTKVRAYLTWQQSGTWRTRYSAIATLSGTSTTTINLPLNSGAAAPTVLAGTTFLLELHFWGTTGSPNKVLIDNLKLQVNNLDFPDFGDSSLITTNANSVVNGRLKLGDTVDSESTANTNSSATGDDLTGSDDEDGVTIPATLVQGQSSSMTVNVTNTTGANAYLNAWIDFNRNGVLSDSGEQVAANLTIGTGTTSGNQTVNFTVPEGASLGATTVRTRLSTTSSPGPTGASGSGEVEDYVTSVVAATLDYGDDSAFGEAFATANANLRLGALVDAEYEAITNTTATGDNTTGSNDEDGVVVTSLVKGRTATVTMTVTNNSGSTAYLNGWIDWNNNGVLTDAGEAIVINTAINSGTTSSPRAVTIDVPTGAVTGTVGARFRLGSTSNPGAIGNGGTGEVEDYAVTVAAPPPTDFAVVIVNYNNNTISRFNGTDGAHLATWSPTGLSAPNYGYRLSDNTLLVANGTSNTITKYNPFTGAYLGTLIGSGNGLNFPYQMAIGPEGLVYIANQNGNNILKFNGATGGSMSTVASISSPAGLAFDSAGKIYVTQNMASGPLKIYSSAGVLQSTVYTWASGENPRGLAWGPDGRLYVNVRDNTNNTGRVDAFAFPGGTRSTFLTMDSGSNPYTGIKWGPDGNLYVVDYGESQVQVYSPTGSVVRTLSTSLSGPHAVAFTDLSANTVDYGDYAGFGIASSTRNAALKLGNEVDTEGASRTSATANGDDIDDLDDEDGVTLPSSVNAGGMTTISLKVTNTTGANAYLNAWWDFNRNGALTDVGELIINNVTVGTGTNNVTQAYTVSVPAAASVGLSGLRFRLTSTANPGATGASGNGEVEDYTATINAQGSDYGDFSGIASASSTVNNALRLGLLVDVESSATSNASATGDDVTDIDDEDGVTIPATLPQGTSVTIPVAVFNNTGANAYLNAWIDFNNDGTLTNTLVSAGGERLEAQRTIVANENAQTVNVIFTVPNAASIGSGRGVRFRLTSATGATASGASGSGEVEDYTATIVSGLSLGNLVWNDANDNGLKDTDESGINNVLVELWSPGADNAIGGTSANADTKVASVNTSGGGFYTFAGLTAGRYFVKVPTPPLSRVSSVVDTGDNGQDDDNDGAQPGGSSTSAFSPVIQLAAGTEPGSMGTGNVDNTIDFGFVANIGSPFVCDNRFYVMQNAETSSGSGVWDSALYYIGPNQELIPVFIFEGYKLNGLAAYGGYLYCVDQNGNHLYRINAAGVLVDMGAVPGLPSPGSSGQWSGATALTNGRMILNQYISSPAQIVLYTLDLATVSLVGESVTCVNAATGTVMPSNFGDIAWDPLTNKVYGYNTIDTAWTGLFEINTTTGVCTRIDTGEAGSFGSLVIDANGLAYGYGSAGATGSQDTLWVFNRTGGVLDGSMTAVGTGPDVSNSDGAACPGAAPSMKIGNLVWNDVNNNGLKDSGESGIDGVTVKLFLGGNDPLTATAAATVTTAGGGLYSFSNLSPGQYFVYLPTPPAAYPLSSSVTDTADNSQDNDDNGIQTTSGQPVRSPLIALTAGTESMADGDSDANTDLTIDFGFRVCPTISIAPTTLTQSTVGTAYSQTLTASGGTSPYAWTVSSGALPSWAVLNGSAGVISGTPTNTTSATFTIRAVDANGCAGTLSYTLTPTCSTITVVPTTLPMAVINTAYSQATAFSASGMSGIYNFAASSIPAGMTFDATNKKLSGTPTAAGLFNVVVTATSASYTACAGSVTVPFRVCPVIALTPTSLVSGIVGTTYSQPTSFGASGGAAPYTFTVNGVPPGMSYDTLTQKLIGTPTTTGSYNVQVSVVDVNGCPGAITLPLSITCPTITVAPSTLVPATVGSAYAQAPVFSATGLTGSYSWSASSVPTGMAFDAVNRRLTGTPTATGVFNVVATATDSTYASCNGSVTVPFRVCPVISISPVTLAGGMVGTAYSQATAFNASGGTAPYIFGTPSGIPSGMAWDSVNRKLIGTPTAVGTSNVVLSVTDVNGCPGSLTVALAIVAPLDYGDYPGFSMAAQTASTEVRIGTATTDYETSNPSTGLATADDTTGTDDEDLTIPSVSPGFATSMTIPVTLSGSVANGRLMVWADWDGNGGVTGTNEVVTATPVTLGTGTTNALVTFSPPSSTSIGTKYLRIMATEGTTTPAFSGVSADRGEVEDYPINVVLHSGLDYGDLPDTGSGTGTGNYKTLQSDGGAAHLVLSGLVLGSTIDTETDALQNSTATGEGADDDSLSLPVLVKGAATSVNVRASNSTGSPAYLSLWIDWNNNGSLEDAGEEMASDVMVANGTNNATFAVSFTVPSTAVLGAQLGVRVRLSQTSGLLSHGLAMSGEVEDYLSTPVLQGITVGDLVWNDLNNDGTYQSATEAGITGVAVAALGLGVDNTLGTGDDTTTSAVTTTGGAYGFVLAPGRYVIRVTPPGAFPLASSVVVTTDNGVNHDNNGSQTGGVGQPVNSPVITLVANGEPGSGGSTNVENTIDFGLRGCPTIGQGAAGSWTATTYAAYSQTITASGGVAPYTWSRAGTLPGGLTFSSGSPGATISGTPDGSLTVGNYAITLTVTDALGCSSSQNFTLVLACPSIAVAGALPGGIQDEVYNQTLTASGGTGPYTWSITGTLPTGLTTATPSSTTFRLSGTPTVVESRTFTIRATDKWGCFKDTSYTVAIGCPVITINPASPLASITQYATMTNVVFSAVGGRSPYAWSIDSATPLPTGLSFVAGTTTLSGIPTAAPGTYNFNVKLTDSSGCPGSKPYAITIVCPAVTISTGATLTAGTTGTAYSQTLAAVTSGTGVPAQTYNWTRTSGTLPPGLSLSAAGVLSGTPTVAGSYSFTLSAANQQGCTGSKAFTLGISCPTLVLTPASLPSVAQYASYSQVLTTSGGTAPYTYTVLSGALPGGVTLTGASLGGTVTASPGSYAFTIKSTDSNNCSTTQAYTVVVNCPTISLLPASAGPFTQYAAITNVVFSASGGTAPYSYSIDSATPLPAGLAFTPATATLSGAPTAAPGSYTVNVKVTDANNCVGNRNYTVVINCNTVSLAPGSFPAGVVGSPYSQTAVATLGGNGVPAQTWTYSVLSGALPAGLNLNAGTGALTGTPTGAASASFTIKAVNAQGCAATKTYAISTACPTVAISTGSILNVATQYTPYSTALAATGGTQPYTWSLLSGALPTGLSINGGLGIISGTATAAPGSYVFTLQVADTYGCAATRAFNLVLECPVITITPPTLPAGTQYAAYTQALTATTSGTNVPAQSYDWGISSGQLPAGLTLNPSTGVISGTPTKYESQTFTVQVKDSNNCVGVITYTLPIDCPPIIITPATLPPATQYAAYSQALTASGGTAPYGWGLDTGSNALPAGLTLSPAGLIGGVPTAAPGNYTFRVAAMDANNCPGYQNYTLTIGCPTLNFSSSTLPAAMAGVAYTQSISASGGTAPYTFTITAGALPAGLSFNGSNGAVSGIPNVMPGVYSLTVRGTDNFGCTGTQGFTIQVNGRDYGDYSGVGSASSLVNSTLKLGVSIDPEGPGIANSSATADDTSGLTPDDEDGITAAPLRRGQQAVVKVAVNNGTGVTAYVSGWIDFNNSGTFDAGEQFASDVVVAAVTSNGSLSLPVMVPFTATTGTNLALRVRLSTATGRAATGDDSVSGEVEDHLVQISPAVTGVGNVVFKDSNGNNRYDGGEGVDGVLVQLFAQGGGSPLSSVTTSGGGRYAFSNLTPGSYFVKIPASEFASGKPLFNAFSIIGNGGDTGVDDATDENGIDVSNPASAGVSTGVFVLSVGGEALSRPGTELGMDAHSDDAQIVSLENNSGNTGVVARTYLTLNDYFGGNPLTTVAGAASFAAGSFKDMTYDPASARFMAWMTSGNAVTASSISDLVTATGTYTNTTSLFSGLGVANFSRTLGIEMVGTTIYTIESNSGGTGIVGRTYTSLANWYSGIADTTVSGNAFFGAGSLRSLGYDRISGLFYGYYDPSGSGSGQVVTAVTLSDLVSATGTYANLGSVHFGQGIINYGKTLSLVNMPVVTTGDANIDLTMDLGFAPCQTIAISPASLVAVTQYTTISNVTLTASGGNAPYTWSIASGTLPAGLSLSNGGVLSGNPTALAGTYNVTVQAVDAYACVGTKAYSIVVNCPTIAISPSSLPGATQYVPYSQAFTAAISGTSVPAQTFTWSLSSGVLPAGLTLNTANGVISGTPTGASTPGNFPLTVRVQNSTGCFATAGYTLVLNCPAIAVAGTLMDGVQDEVYPGTTLSASGGTAPYLWSVVGSMPTGLTLNSNTGVVSGMPTVVQSATFTLRATDVNGCVGTRNYTIAVGCPVITINPPSPLNPVTQYSAMTSVAFSAVGGRTPYLWSIDSATPLPAGLTFTPATATLSGTPTAVPGTYNFTVKLVDNSGCPGSKSYSLTVNCPTITVGNATPLPNGTVGVSYSQTLTATTVGTGVPAQTYTWSLASGTLPTGLSLSSGGVMSGIPTATASATVTVRATNAQGCTGTKALAINVVCPTITLSPSSLVPGYVNGAYNASLSATGGSAPYSYAITSGTLPSGLAFNTSSGLLSGTPTATASVTLTILATDKYNCTGSITYPLVIKTLGIGNLVYADCNNSGTFDAGDTGLAGALVQLYRPGADNSVNTADDVQVGGSFTTTSSGAYSFSSIPPGNYFVKVTPPSTHQKSGGIAVTADNRVDNDNNGAQSAIGAPLFSPVISLADGAEPSNDGDTDAGTDWTVDFGIWSGMQAGNHVWNDANNNGVKDAGESGISGLAVELMSPGADNAVGGTAGNADSVVASTTTSGDGSYGFLVYTMGHYFVRVSPSPLYPLPSGVSVAADNGVDNDNNGINQPAFAGTYVNTMVFELSGCETENTIDVGLRSCPTMTVAPGTLPAAVLGAVYSSGSITATGGTAPYTWSIVTGTLPTGMALNTVSGSSANITGVPSGSANSYNITLQVRDALGCVTTRGYTIAVSCPVITITPETLPVAYQGAVFSQTLTSTGSIGAVNWSVNPALPTGLSLNPSTGVISGTPTAPVGIYNVVVTSTDSNNCQASISYAISVRSMGIGNLVWYDCNNNGLKDSEENGLAGAVVTLCRSGADNLVNTADDVVIGNSITTTSSGAYNFTGIPPGNYYVKVVPPVGYSRTAGVPVALDNRVDNDNNGSQPAGLATPVFSAIISLADGAEPITDGDTDSNSDWTIDFGFWTGFTVGDRVWFDANGDGLYQSASESGVSGLTVELLTPGSDNAVGGTGGAADTVVATTSTSTSGVYGFTVYVAGSYYLRVVPNGTYPLVGFTSVQADNGVDGDNNGMQPGGAGAPITSMVFALAPCTEPAATGAENIENTIDIAVRNCPTITLSPTTLASATQYQSYNQTLTVSGAVAPYQWTLVSGTLPAGITLSNASSTTATLTGIASAMPGTYNFTLRATDALLCSSIRAYSIVVNCPTITIAPGSIPAATQFTPYSQTFTASMSGTGVPAQTYSWSLSSGVLPVGLSLSPTSGVISGTPTGASAPGNYPLTLRVQNAAGCFATAGYTVVLACPSVVVAGTLTDGVQDEAYPDTMLSASGGSAPYAWSVMGAMPDGLSLHSSTGVVSGMPTLVQSATFTVRVTDKNGCIGTRNFTIAVGCPVITINPPSPLTPVTQYTAMSSVVFSAVGGRTPYSWSIDSATPLPEGLTFTPSAARLSGTPTAIPGVYNFTVKLVDSSGCPASKSYSLTVMCPSVTVGNVSPLPNGVVGSAYSQTLIATTNGTGVPAQTYTWSLASGTLPAGLSLSSGGVISGTPTAAATATVTVQAANAQGCAGTKALALTVVCPVITLSPSTLVPGYVNGAYSATVGASGGTAPYVYAITSGTLPAGLTFNTTAGTFGGTPTAVGSASLVIRATDRYGCTGSITYSLPIRTLGIGNLVWDDCNNNGIKDLTESGLAGAIVQLFRSGPDNMVNSSDDVQVGANQITTGSGAYSFTNIPPGSYFVKVTPPGTHQKSGGSPIGIDNRIDNDNNGMQSAIGAPLYSPVIGLSDGLEPINDGDSNSSTDWSVDFGVYSGVRAGNLVWADDDQDGIKDPEESGIGGLTMHLMSPGSDNAVGGSAGAADTVVATTTTAPDGSYEFLVYTPANYFVRVMPNGVYMLPSLNPVAVDDNVDNDNNAVSQPMGAGTFVNGMVFSLTGCEKDHTIDMGLRVCPVLVVTPLSIGPVTQYTPVKVDLDVSGGTEPYTWNIQSGVLPEGLDLNTIGPATAVVSGNPTAVPATYNVTIRVRDALGCILDVQYPILVMCPTITMAPETIAPATQYVAYSQPFTASTDGTSVPVQTYTWSVTGVLPSGLNFNSSTGVLSGTPSSSSQPGSYPITVRVQDGSGCFTTQGYTLELLCPQITIAGTVGDGVQDEPYSVALSASGGTSPYGWTVLGTLPAGLTLTPTGSTTAVLAGTPDMVESMMFSIIATDAHGCQAIRPASIAINCPPIIISPPMLPAATQYTPLPAITFSAVGGRTPYAWSIDSATPVPAGLTFNAATATLSGTPTAAPGVYPLHVKLVDKSGCPGSNAYLLTIGCPAVSIAPTSLPSGVVGTAYSQTLSASMTGTGIPAQTWTWSLDSGTLPTGLTLNSSTGVLSGTPSVTATTNITIRATNAQGCYGTQALTLTTACPGMAVTPGVLPDAVQYSPGYQLPLIVTGGTAPFTWALTGSLPAGLTLDPASGLISGTTTASAASFPVTVTVNDSFGCSASKSYTLVVQSIDRGDLASLPTAGSNIVPGLKMGNSAVDADRPSQANMLGNGDDISGVDDEDGVTFAPLTIGTTVLISVKVANTTAAPAYLNAWIDFNGNGSLEAGEQIVTGQVVNAGNAGAILDFSVAIPGTSTEQLVAARFRLSSDGSGAVGGVSGNGEVEDYLIQLCEPRPCGKTYVSQN